MKYNMFDIDYAVDRGIRYSNGDIIGVSGRILKPRSAGKGYRTVQLPTIHGYENVYIHKLVWYFETGDYRAFSDDYEIHHVNRIRHDNRFENLELLPSAIHESLSSRLNTRAAKITVDIANQIKSIYNTGKLSQKKIAEKFNLSQGHISDIVNDKKWQKFR